MNEKADAAQNISKDFPIVAIGASAGGVEAITELFKHVAPDTGMAFVYVQHLDPNFPSKLTEIISRVTKMNVVEAKNLMPLEPNSVYIIPPNKEMGLQNGDLILNARKEDGYARMPIDHFFISVSQNHDKGVIGIILSGTASDGTLGLRAIKSVGGISFAQDDSAQFQSMPRSAVSEGAVDMVLSPKQMAIELERLSKQKNLLLEVAREDGTKIKDDEEGDLKAILHLLKKSTSVDFI
ncbi:MAG: chemotaxis protein CheB, partial [Flavisolibacter sp.]